MGLGWLILPEQRRVRRSARAGEPVGLDHPARIGDDVLLPGLALPLVRIREPGF